MVSIELHNLQLHAFHGIHDGESKTGNRYIVDLVVQYEEGDTHFDELSSTINYVELYEIVKQRMQVNTPLLERLCEGIIRRIKHQYPFINQVNISVFKLEAPIENFQGKVGVSMLKKFSD